MKNLFFVGLSILMLATISCNAQPNQKATTAVSSGDSIEVYYFHFSARCMTCNTVEAETKKNLELLYPEQVKSGNISFTSLNLDEDAGKEAGSTLGVSGQTLLIVQGDQKINITNEGFLYAVSQPEKFKEVIRSKIDPLIKE